MTGVQYGALTGAAFAIPYTLCALLFSPLVDRWNRRNLLALAIVLWSLSSAVRSRWFSRNLLFFFIPTRFS